MKVMSAIWHGVRGRHSHSSILGARMVRFWPLQKCSLPTADGRRLVRPWAALAPGFFLGLPILAPLVRADDRSGARHVLQVVKARRPTLWVPILLALIVGIPAPALPAPVKHVLVLYPYDNALPSTNLAGAAVRKRLAEIAGGNVVVHTAFLDLVEYPNAEDMRRTAEYLAEKHARSDFDALIALNTESFRFALKYRDTFAPGVPMVFCCVTRAFVKSISDLPPDVTGVISDYDMARTLELALQLQPDTRHVFFLSGASDVDHRWLEGWKPQIDPYGDRFDLEYLVGLPFDELLDRVERLPPDSVILSGTLFQDGTGRQMVPAEATAAVAERANAPVYVPADPYIGTGAVGGYMATFEGAGTEAADMVLQILGGAKPQGLHPRTAIGQHYRIDARALDRWSLPRNRLPADSVLLYDSPSIWEQYRELVLAALLVIGLQSLMLIGLVLQFQRRRRAEAAMRSARADLARITRVTTMGELTASIAHEVNQPLAAIVANGNAALRWLGHATPDLSEAREAMARIVQDGLRAADVIAAIRGMVRRGEPASQSLDMGDLVREVLGLLRGEIERNGVTVAREIEENLPSVRGDRVQLQQVILNLVMNAVEAMVGQAAGERRLGVLVARDGDDHVTVSVSDTGPGIPADAAARVFEPFYTTKNHGMGMGLSICRTIVEAHGGKLSLGRNMPRGTTFIVALQTERRSS